MPVSSYNWHPHTKRRYAFTFGALALAAVVWFATRGESDLSPRIITFAVVFVSLFLLVEQDARVDSQAGMMVREGRLFGRFLVWRWRNRLSGFTGIGFRRQHDPEDGDTVFVGLRRQSGRLVAIRYYFVGAGQPCYEAERVGQSLAEATGLQLYEEMG